MSEWVHWRLASVKPAKITQRVPSTQASFLLLPSKKESGPCVLVVALCGRHHIATSAQNGESLHRWLLAGRHWQEALRALPKALGGICGCFLKTLFLTGRECFLWRFIAR